MNQFQNAQISFSPKRQQHQYFPAINLKTAESPQKGSIEQSNYIFSQHLHNKFNNRKIKMNMESQLKKACTIRKYLQLNSSVQYDLNMSDSKILQNISTTQNKETSIQINQSLSPLRQLNKIEDHSNLIRLSDIHQTQPNINLRQQSQSPIHNQCIIESDKEQDERNKKQYVGIQEQLNMSPIQFTNFKDISEYKEYKQSKSQSPNRHNIVLRISQQNTEYKKYASQIIRMIRNNQQNLMKKFDQEQLDQERDYKFKKIQRQKERKEGLQNAQEGIKNRQLKFMLIALKGQQEKVSQDSQLFANSGKKLNLQSSQTAIKSRKSSLQINFQELPLDKQFYNRISKKYSLKSEICRIDTSLEQPLQISKLI